MRSMDEFGQIAGYLNQMQANIKAIMERERMAEHTKNDLISSVAMTFGRLSPPLLDIWAGEGAGGAG